MDKTRWTEKRNGFSRFQRLKMRQQIIAAIRDDLSENDFLEVEVPLLIKGTTPDAHIDSIELKEGYLTTSTEYQIKRMVVGGFQKLFTLTKNFRAGDEGRFHSSEFTMLEWARALESLDAIEEDAQRFIRKAFQKLYPNSTDFFSHPWERLTVREAFKKYLNLENLGDFSLKPLQEACREAHLSPPFFEDKNLLISYLFDLLQPNLGVQTPTFLREWPSYLTSSAPLNPNDPYTAQRSELYIAGIEIADGFPFLTDPKKQRELFNETLQQRKDLNKPQVAIDQRFLEALDEGMPHGAGMALGIDRLVMVLTHADCLADTQAFSWDEL